MAKRKKAGQSSKKLENKSSLVIGMWIVALVIAFILMGSVVRSILWIFILGAVVSYYVLNKK